MSLVNFVNNQAVPPRNPQDSDKAVLLYYYGALLTGWDKYLHYRALVFLLGQNIRRDNKILAICIDLVYKNLSCLSANELELDVRGQDDVLLQATAH